MNPDEIARSIGDDSEQDFAICPERDCQNPYAMETVGKIDCPNPKCILFNSPYHDAVRAVVLPGGVTDYNSLVNWFKLYVQKSQMPKEGTETIPNTIARFLVDYEVDIIGRPKELLAEILMEGHEGYWGNEKLVKEQVDEFMGDDPEGFMSQFEDHYNVYYHRPDY